jgi:hypothetical protein
MILPIRRGLVVASIFVILVLLGSDVWRLPGRSKVIFQDVATFLKSTA